MGWKLAVVIARLETRSLANFVDEIYGAPQHLAASEIPVEDAYDPSPISQRFALEYRGRGWVFDRALVENSFASPLSVPFLLWTFGLNSFNNWYGFTVQENGARVRCRSGSSDKGITDDFGTPSELERQLVKACAKPGNETQAIDAWTHASKSFAGPDGETTHDVIGESVVFGLIAGVTGFRIDMFTPETSAFMNARVMKVAPHKR